MPQCNTLFVENACCQSGLFCSRLHAAELDCDVYYIIYTAIGLSRVPGATAAENQDATAQRANSSTVRLFHGSGLRQTSVDCIKI